MTTSGRTAPLPSNNAFERTVSQHGRTVPAMDRVLASAEAHRASPLN
jgi:hypothetical protein